MGAAAIAAVGLTAPASAAPDATNVVINEVYGGGGNSGATYTHDFVELYNPTGEPIDLTGLAIDYYSSTGGRGTSVPLTGTIGAGDYYLIQMAKGNGGGHRAAHSGSDRERGDGRERGRRGAGAGRFAGPFRRGLCR